MNEEVKFKNIILVSIIVLLISIIVFLIVTKPKIRVYYNNKEIEENVNINLNSSDNRLKIYTNYLGKDISKYIKKEGQFDITKVGSYKIKYSLKKFIYNMKKEINVNIIDNVSPEIILTGEKQANACSMQTYEEEGYSASDNYDGDITDKVIVSADNGTITYEVSDSSGNKTTVERQIIVSDTEKPKIELKGGNEIYLELNEKFSDPGYEVSDNCDKDLGEVNVTGSVDTSKTGSYTITYSVSDSSDNNTTVKRNIYVFDPKLIENNGTTENRMIYLTFDDGPSIYTSKILDTLKKYNIKATFFVTKNGKDSLIKREYKEGHTVALHTYSHDYKTVYSSVDGYFKDLKKVEDRVYKIINERPTIIRFPGGSSNTISKNYSKGIMKKLTLEVLIKGYHYFDWTASVEDAGSCAKKATQTARENCVYSKFKKGLSKKKSNVVLMHDIKSYTADKLEDMIKYALANGYSFDKITMETKQVHHTVNN